MYLLIEGGIRVLTKNLTCGECPSRIWRRESVLDRCQYHRQGEEIVLSLASFVLCFIAYQLSEMTGECDDMSQLQETNKLNRALSLVAAGQTYFWEHMILGLCELLTGNWLADNWSSLIGEVGYQYMES